MVFRNDKRGEKGLIIYETYHASWHGALLKKEATQILRKPPLCCTLGTCVWRGNDGCAEPRPQSYGNPARVRKGGVVQGWERQLHREREREIGGRVWICDGRQQGGSQGYFWRGFMRLDTRQISRVEKIVKSTCIVAYWKSESLQCR